jgi:hypothetical protein
MSFLVSGFDGSGAVHTVHARPFVGVFKSQCTTGLSIFDNNFPQNGSKNGAEGAGIPPRRAFCDLPWEASGGHAPPGAHQKALG